MSENSSIWWPRFVGDYQRKTSHLSLSEHGAYALLLDHYYATGKSLTRNREILYRICRVFKTKDREAVDNVLEQFFELTETGYFNKRAEEEIAKHSKIRQKRKSAARMRWASTDANAYAHGDACADPKGYSDAMPTTTTATKKKDKEGNVPVSGGVNFQEKIQLPDWVPAEPWSEFVLMRKKSKKPPTDYAVKQLLKKLEQFKNMGHDPAEILNESTVHGWADLYQPKIKQTQSNWQVGF